MDAVGVKRVWTIDGGFEKRYHGYTGNEIVHRSNTPKEINVTYAWFVCDYILQKDVANLCHIPVGVDRVEYLGDISTKTVDLMTIKCLLNSVLSKLRARFMTADVKNLYLNTLIDIPERMRIAVKMSPAEVME